MRESIRKFELVHAPGLAQLDISSAQVFVHIAIRKEKSGREENSRRSTIWRRRTRQSSLRVHCTRTRIRASAFLAASSLPVCRGPLIAHYGHWWCYLFPRTAYAGFSRSILERMLWQLRHWFLRAPNFHADRCPGIRISDIRSPSASLRKEKHRRAKTRIWQICKNLFIFH